jgi:hypothetical protein
MSKIYVVEFKTEKVIDSINVSGKSQREIDKVMMGLMRNMNLERFYVTQTHPDDQPQEQSC